MVNTTTPAGPLGQAPMSDDLDLAQSAAGEEDPGASIDMVPASVVCSGCGGSGRAAQGMCPVCQGTGKVTAGIGGA